MPQEIVLTAIEAIEANLKCKLETIKLYFNEYIVLFTDQIFKDSLWQKTWSSICFKKPDQVFQLLLR